MDTPIQYTDICDKALMIQKNLNLSDTQTLLYNMICKKDFYLFNGTGQNFFDKDHEGFGYFGDREWVNKQLKPLIKNKLVKLIKKKSPRDNRYTLWYFLDSESDLSDLIDSSCYVTTHMFFRLKNYFNLPDGFDRNGQYGDLKFFKRKNCWNLYEYVFIYKDKSMETYEYDNEIYPEGFSGIIHKLWKILEKHEFKYDDVIPNITKKRFFKITKK